MFQTMGGSNKTKSFILKHQYEDLQFSQYGKDKLSGYTIQDILIVPCKIAFCLHIKEKQNKTKKEKTVYLISYTCTIEVK